MTTTGLSAEHPTHAPAFAPEALRMLRVLRSMSAVRCAAVDSPCPRVWRSPTAGRFASPPIAADLPAARLCNARGRGGRRGTGGRGPTRPPPTPPPLWPPQRGGLPGGTGPGTAFFGVGPPKPGLAPPAWADPD